ncbi:MAG: glycoside hydrolase family 5 protein [Fibromonadales bacterium]|nr:glycoside hydrolase family 5 protein [Fibromonadales bacterium]
MNLKKLLSCVGLSLALALILSCSDNNSNSSQDDSGKSPDGNCTDVLPKGNSPVEAYGELKVKGNKLVGSKTGCAAVQVKGVSLGWSNSGWESARFFNSTAVNAMVSDWKAEIVRVPMGYAASSAENEWNGRYLQDKTNNMKRVKDAIDAAIAKNVYVIIDWHAHNAHERPSDAIEFFTAMAQTYGANDHVIFEIYNEPKNDHGGTWENIKAYAEQVIPVIRAHSDNLILVGTRHYSRHLEDVVGNALTDNNVGYVLHFYSENLTLDRILESDDPSSPTFRGAITQAVNAGLLVFISEYGTTNSNGGQGDKLNSHDSARTDEWMAFLDEHKISSCAWHVNNKGEGSAFFTTSFNPLSGDYNDKGSMKASGAYIYDMLNEWARTVAWRK